MKRFLISLQAFLFFVAFAPYSSVAVGFEVAANFDSFPEGSLGTDFVDGGIRFSDLENDSLGVFSADSRDETSAFPQMSLPNTLSTFGFANGSGGAFYRLRSFIVTPPNIANSASLDLFLSLHPEVVDRRFQVDAFFNNQIIATTSVLAGTGSPLPNGEYHHLAIEASSFDRLKLSATDLEGNPSYTFATFDNFRIRVVPEPNSLMLIFCGGCILISFGRRPLPI